IFIIAVTININAQWVKATGLNVGNTGKLLAHNTALFLYGNQNGFKLYRSTDGAVNWTDIANKFPYDVYYMHVHQNEIFAVTTTLGGNSFHFYVSKDDGATWSHRSTISNITGNGAVLGLSSDGNILYASSNRKSYYKSIDNGITWKETVINTTAGGNLVSIAASGELIVSVILGTGALVSMDDGLTWNVKNPQTAISGLFQHKGSIYGLSFGAGLFKWNKTKKEWEAINNGIPDAGSFQIPTTMLSSGNNILAATRGLISTKTTILSSKDEGETWTPVLQTGLPDIQQASAFGFMAASNTNLYLYNHLLTGGAVNVQSTGVYKSTLTPTSVKNSVTLPEDFSLSQNYPNPFNPSTVISYKLQSASHVTLKVYDVLGKEAAVLVDEYKQAGTYNSQFSILNSQLTSGIYFYRLQAGNFVQTKKMTMLK
ncbi:MAG: T9SS type A sorting domain-containing protein, partial [Bacteroidota bacterium]